MHSPYSMIEGMQDAIPSFHNKITEKRADMDNRFLCGILIGLLFGMPAGAVGAMTVQRTLNYGMKSGLLTGLGSSVADCFYACVGAFGLTIISEFLLTYQSIIHIFGGGLILLMGIRLLVKKTENANQTPEASGGFALFLSSFAVGITNPAAILTFLFAFSWFGLSKHMGMWAGIQLVCGVFLGTYLWWGGLSAGVTLLKKKIKPGSFGKANRIFGVILVGFSLVIFIRAAFA